MKEIKSIKELNEVMATYNTKKLERDAARKEVIRYNWELKSNTAGLSVITSNIKDTEETLKPLYIKQEIIYSEISDESIIYEKAKKYLSNIYDKNNLIQFLNKPSILINQSKFFRSADILNTLISQKNSVNREILGFEIEKEKFNNDNKELEEEDAVCLSNAHKKGSELDILNKELKVLQAEVNIKRAEVKKELGLLNLDNDEIEELSR